jgi:methionine aminopeptidase
MNLTTRMGEEAWGAHLEEPKNERVLPKTLAEAVPNPVIGVNREEIRKDLQDLKGLAEESFKIVSQFTSLNHGLGLALNKIATIANKVSELQKKY